MSGRTLLRAARHRLSTFRGLGDLLAWTLALVGIHAAGACGCHGRQKWLNRLVPFRFAGKSMFDRRSSIAVTATLVNRWGTPVFGRLQIRAGDAEPLVVELPALAAGATATVLEGWTTNQRSRDRWTWMLEDGVGRIFTGSVVCAVEGPVEIRLEATPRARIAFRQAHGACVVDLRVG
jgi:hypothetical protein